MKNICKKLVITLTNDTLSCKLDGKFHNLYGPAKIDFIKFRNKIRITGIHYFVNDRYENKRGSSGIIFLDNKVLDEAYWDISNNTITKQYYVDGSVKSIFFRNIEADRYYNRHYDVGKVKDNIIQEYNKNIPKIKELFRLAGNDMKFDHLIPG